MATVDYDKVIEDNFGLVISIVKKFKPKNQNDFGEMLQCGRIGLWKAIKYHKPEFGKLTTIAHRSIRWEIYAYIKQKKRCAQQITKINQDNKLFDTELGMEEILPDLTSLESSIFEDLMSGETKTAICLKNKLKTTKLNSMIKEIYKKIYKANDGTLNNE